MRARRELMRPEKIKNLLNEKLEAEGFLGKIISIKHVQDLKAEIEAKHKAGLFDQEFFTAELSRFDFKHSYDFAKAESLIIIAAPQSRMRVTFQSNDRSYPITIPPTYNYATDKRIKELLQTLLMPEGYHLSQVNLPLKLLAACSGLTKYGKNNVTYIDNGGSFFRLAAFNSDFPFLDDDWGELKSMETCQDCTACTEACPTGAIPRDRFLLRAEKCLTFHNERREPFPQWIDPVWHNCLVGCMYCQNVCPLNKDLLKKVQTGPVFSSQETDWLLQNRPQDHISRPMAEKLEELGMIEYYSQLGRNLKVLFDKRQKTASI